MGNNINKVYNVFGTLYARSWDGFIFCYARKNNKWFYQGTSEDFTFVENAGVLVGLNWRLK